MSISRGLQRLSRFGLYLPVCLWLGLSGVNVFAQPANDGDSPTDGAQSPGAADEVPVTDQPGGIQSGNETGDEDGDGSDADEAEEGAGRFIPSEQISQDLGVSFPADI